MSTQNQSRTVVLAIVIIAAGVLLLLNSMRLIPHDLGRVLITWQMLLIAIGTVSLLTSKEKVTGLILISIGGIFLIGKMYDLPVSVWNILWPTVLIIVGVSLLYGNSCKARLVTEFEPRPAGKEDTSYEPGNPEYINEVAIFGGNEKNLIMKQFRGGKITNIFGGSELNFSKTELAEGENYLEMLCVFGGSTLVVPPDWDIRMDVVSIFGGFSDKRYKRQDSQVMPNKKLIIKGLVIFGGGELKSY